MSLCKYPMSAVSYQIIFNIDPNSHGSFLDIIWGWREMNEFKITWPYLYLYPVFQYGRNTNNIVKGIAINEMSLIAMSLTMPLVLASISDAPQERGTILNTVQLPLISLLHGLSSSSIK